MEFGVKSGSPEKQRSACIVVGVFEPRRLSAVAEQLDRVSDGYLSSLLRRGDLEGKTGQMLLLHQVPGVLSERVLLVGCSQGRFLSRIRSCTVRVLLVVRGCRRGRIRTSRGRR